MKCSISFLSVLLVLQLISTSAQGDSELFQLADISPDDDLLNYAFYHKSCPDLDRIISLKVKEWIKKDFTLGASLLRLHFHDCSVRGCDASILLDYEESEKTAEISKTLRGFEIIDDIKAEVEKRCPKTVSCADILTAAARDATVEVGGPYWSVPFGRKDGKISLAKEAQEQVPKCNGDTTSLIEFAQSVGLNFLDLVVLSGAHTIGRATCGSVQDRLYNFNNTGKCDPSMDPKYASYLRRKCRWASEYVELDAITPKVFDNMYYKNLQRKMALLSTDHLLYSDSRTSFLVEALAASPQLFEHLFKAAMTKFGKIKVLAGDDEGEIRTDCRRRNY